MVVFLLDFIKKNLSKQERRIQELVDVDCRCVKKNRQEQSVNSKLLSWNLFDKQKLKKMLKIRDLCGRYRAVI